jgi:NADP-dependent 3-hydroxy acid dehydrogenase YdfG
MSSTRDLNGASVLVVGATGVLGRHIARSLHAAGAVLTLHGRSAATLTDLAAQMPGSASLLADIRDAGAAPRLVEASTARSGRLDGVVIASGVVAFGELASTDEVVAEDLFLTNTLGPLWVLSAALPALQASSGFACVITGVVAATPMPGMAPYCGSKAALSATLSACRKEVGRAVDVIEVQPPHTETGLAGRPLAGTAPRLPRGLSPESVAARTVSAIVSRETLVPATAFSG